MSLVIGGMALPELTLPEPVSARSWAAAGGLILAPCDEQTEAFGAFSNPSRVEAIERIEEEVTIEIRACSIIPAGKNLRTILGIGNANRSRPYAVPWPLVRSCAARLEQCRPLR